MSLRPCSSSASAGRLMATWLKRGWPGLGIALLLRDDEDFARQLARDQQLHRPLQARQRHVVGLDEQVGGELRGGEQAEAVLVVGRGVLDRAGDDELVEDDAV